MSDEEVEEPHDEGPRSSLFKEYREDLMSYLSHVRNEIKEILQDESYLLKLFAAAGGDTDEVLEEKGDNEADEEEGNFVIDHSDTFKEGELALYIEKMYDEFSTDKSGKLRKVEVCMFLEKFLKVSRTHSVNQIRSELDAEVRAAMKAWKKKKMEEDPSFQGDLDAASTTFWRNQLPTFKEVIQAHHQNMIEEKIILTEELMEMMDENHDGFVSKREFMHTFTKAMEEVVPTHLFSNIQDEIIKQFDFHSKPSATTVKYHMQVKHFKTLQDGIFSKLQSEKSRYLDDPAGEAAKGDEDNAIKPSYQTWRLLSTNDIRAFNIALEHCLAHHGDLITLNWKKLQHLWGDDISVDDLLGSAGIELYFKKLNELAYEANTKATSSLGIVFDDFDREFSKSMHGLNLVEIEDLLKCYLNEYAHFAYIVFLAILEPELRKRIRNIPHATNRSEQIRHPFDRYLVYAIFHYVGKEWKRAFSSYYQVLCESDKIESIARKVFIILDTNKDGIIQKHELVRGFGRAVHKIVAGVGSDMILRKKLMDNLYSSLQLVLKEMEKKLTTNFKMPLERSESEQKDFYRYVKNGYKEETARMLKANPSLVESRFRGNWTPLHVAVDNRWSDVVDYLLGVKNVDINAETSFGVTPLHKAAQKGYIKILKTLLNDDADVNAKDTLGNSPLHYAVMHGHRDIFETLTNKSKIELDIRNNDGYTAKDLCLQYHQDAMLQSLQESQMHGN